MSSPPRPTTKVEEPDAPEAPRTITLADFRSCRSIAARTGSRSRRRRPPGIGQLRHLALGHRDAQLLRLGPHVVLLVGVLRDPG